MSLSNLIRDVEVIKAQIEMMQVNVNTLILKLNDMISDDDNDSDIDLSKIQTMGQREVPLQDDIGLNDEDLLAIVQPRLNLTYESK